MPALFASNIKFGATGDFKTANLFFKDASDADSSSANAACSKHPLSDVDASEVASIHLDASASFQVAACDFQWVGMGSAVQDVVYLLWTSTAPEIVVQYESAIVDAYTKALRHKLQSRGAAADQLPTSEQIGRIYEVCLGALHNTIWSCTARIATRLTGALASCDRASFCGHIGVSCTKMVLLVPVVCCPAQLKVHLCHSTDLKQHVFTRQVDHGFACRRSPSWTMSAS